LMIRDLISSFLWWSICNLLLRIILRVSKLALLLMI
jgi:hypothetical protein